jgi:hypothetical protein
LASSLNDLNSLFPGENLFLYWKTSSSLWRDKLSVGIKGERVLVPINWAIHTINGEEYDFARKKPETDLKKLVNIISELGKEVTFLLPLTPVPFLPNGGMPPFLASYPAWCPDSLQYSMVDQEDRIHHFYSYYDPRVYRAFHKFVQHLAGYIEQENINCDIWGLSGGAIDEDGEYRNYLFDSSPIFDQVFSRFLQVQKDEALENGGEELIIDSPEKEAYYLEEFRTLISNMYQQSASELLAENWEGVLPVSFVGGGVRDIFSRMSGRDSVTDYLHDAQSSITQDVVPFSTLLAGQMGESTLGKFFDNLVTKSFMPNRLLQSSYLEQGGNLFAPLSFVNLYRSQSAHIEGKINPFKQNGLINLLEQRYRHCYQQLRVEEGLPVGSIVDLGDEQQERELIHFFSARNLNLHGLKQVLNLFMQGGWVVLDRAHIVPALQKRLDSFILENSLTVSDVNFHTMVSEIRLGESRMLLLDSDDLVNKYLQGWDGRTDAELPSKVVQFWERVVGTFEIQHLPIDPPPGVHFFWYTRSANSQELSFHEIRRVNLFNASSYKRKVMITGMEKFAPLKVVDEIRCEVQTGRKEISVELLPWGSLAVDFGLYL